MTEFSYNVNDLNGYTNYTFAITAATSTLDDPQFTDPTYDGPMQSGNTSTITVTTGAGGTIFLQVEISPLILWEIKWFMAFDPQIIIIFSYSVVYPIGIPEVRKIDGADDKINLVIPQLSTEYGPLRYAINSNCPLSPPNVCYK